MLWSLIANFLSFLSPIYVFGVARIVETAHFNIFEALISVGIFFLCNLKYSDVTNLMYKCQN